MDLINAVNKAKQGDNEAFGLIYDQFAQRIFSYVRQKVQDRQQAEDILQDVFVKAYRGLPTLSEEGLNFSAWLYKIASNTVNDHFRKSYRSPGLEPIENHQDLASPVSVEKDLVLKDDNEKLKQALFLLPENYREVLQLRYIEDLTLAETAKILNKSNLAVRLSQHRALKKLEVILKNFYDLDY